jgi:uncharacterized protein YukE
MQEVLEQCRSDALILCDRLLAALAENREDANSFFAGELHQAYDAATDKAENKVVRIKNMIRNL